jgi:hypothetical protein
MSRPSLGAIWIAVAAAAVAAQQEEPVEGSLTRRARRELAFDVPPEPAIGQVRWLCNWFDAMEEARRRDVVVLAVLSDDKSSGFQTVRGAVYSQPEFVRFADRFVLLAAFDGASHGAKKREIDGREVEWCPLFDGLCDDHRQTYVKVKNTYAMREYWNPLQVFLDCQGVELGRVEGHFTTVDKLKEEHDLVTKGRGAGLAGREHRELLARLRGIVDARTKKGSAWAHRELAKLREAEAKAKASGGKPVLVTAPMQEFVESLELALLDEGDGLLEDADELARRKDLAGARRLLVEIQRSFKGLAPAEDAVKALAELGK